MQNPLATYGKMTRKKKVNPKLEIFTKNIGLVHYVVNRLNVPLTSRSSAAIERADLIQFGIIGLLDAIERFDPERGVQFQTYAMSRIRGTVQDELRKLDWVPRSVRKKIRDAEAITKSMDQQTSNGASYEQVAKRLSLTMDEYLDVIQDVEKNLHGSAISLDDNSEIAGAMVTDENDDPFEITSASQMKELVIEEIELLPEKERLVIMLYYYEELTFKEIGNILHLSESRVFQIHNAVLGGLRRRLRLS